MTYDELVFWILIVMLCLITLTTGRDWWRVVQRIYRHAVDVWKWSPYLKYITGVSNKRKKLKIPESELGAHHGVCDQKNIFPRSRRST
ncbi:MAG: hypothetical protein JXR73_21635 [Candidatus Omnitrophica bacterium]|nr:hypothetical protein [Candidatus Omnitrophota bacterium]